MFLLVGGDSEIGAATCQYLRDLGKPVAATSRRAPLSADRLRLDLASDLSAWEPPRNTTAACIFAAQARLVDCAADPAGSSRINVAQTLTLVDRLTARGIHVLFLSTNRVFDGAVAHVPAEADPCPVTEYGRQKALTEAGLREKMRAGAPIAILRFAKVVSPGMRLLVDWADALARGDRVRAFFDLPMAPTPVALASAAIAALLEARATGIFQLTGPEDVTYADVARHIARRIGADPALVDAVSAKSAGLPEDLAPRHSTLDSSALRQRFGIVPPGPWEVVDAILDAVKLG
jgi:dTDP-4-dehydrorhamnose reductase